MKTVLLDVMDARSGRFIFQMPYTYWEAFPVNFDDIREAVFTKRPSLRSRDISIGFSDQRTYVYS